MNQRRYRRGEPFDDYGQVDGDAPAAVAFQAGGLGQPWLRGGVPPWHMWGSSQVVRANATGSDEATVFSSGQLAKVSYKRPDTWHFLLTARIINAPVVPLSNELQVHVRFDFISGIGRSQSQLIGFDLWNWGWTQNEQFPTYVLWATTAKTPPLRMVFDPDTEFFIPDPLSIRDCNELVGQDIQVNCGVALQMRGINEGDQTTADVEVSAYLAPKTHVRPDWFLEGTSPEVNFGGDEIRGA